jgi:hypothetical protein
MGSALRVSFVSRPIPQSPVGCLDCPPVATLPFAE